MLDWLKNLIRQVPGADDERVILGPDEAMRALQTMVTDAIVDELYDALDHHAAELGPTILELVKSRSLGEYPLHTATIWLGYQVGNAGQRLDPWLDERIEDSITWAFQFEENNVLLGGALGAMDGLEDLRREEMALSILSSLETPRRYWLLMKVRSDAFVAAVVESLEGYEDSWRARAAGGFRQFKAADLPVLMAHYDVENAGAELLVEALAATRSQDVRPLLEEALEDERTGVSEAARRGLNLLDL